MMACGGNEPVPPVEETISRDRFIEVVVAVRQAEHDVSDADSAQALFEARRDSIMEALSVTEADLERFVASYRDLGELDAVWDTITHRLKRPLSEAGTRRGQRFDEAGNLDG